MKNDPTIEILLGLLRSEPVVGVTQEQWRSVALLAKQHRVSSLLFWRLKTLGITGQVPADLLQELHSATLATLARNLRIYNELNVLFERFQQDKIEGILLKGAYLAEEVYQNAAIRPMDDVDLLVKESDLERVGEIMAAMGFIRPYETRESSIEFHHFGFTHASNGLYVEVHWDLIDKIYDIKVDLDGLWERSQAARIADLPVRVMTPEDLLLHLCVHTSVHAFKYGLSAMCDLDGAIRQFQESIDWVCLRQRAYAWNAERCVYINMRLARELLHAPVPEEWLNTLLPTDFHPNYLAIAHQLLFAGGQITDVKVPSWPRLVKFWKAGSLAEKIALMWKRLFLSRQGMALIYHVPPGSLRVLLYYPVRFLDLLKENSRLGWLLLRGDKQKLSQADQQEQVNSMISWLLEGDYL